MTKQKTTKIAALIALIAIFSSVIGTGVLVVFETYFSQKKESTLTQNELNELFKTGALTNSGKDIENNTGITDKTLTGITK